jgi:ElaB/YqjD/DUF883 family membrane-anchored ribosome-binding protein
MAKKKTARSSSKSPQQPDPAADAADVAEQAEGSPKVRAAAQAVERAEEELEKAKQAYQRIRSQAVDRLQQAREKTVGDLIDGTLGLVRKHPGPGVILAVLAGFFLGRLFRR